MARILLIDDDESVRASLGAVLRRHGHEVVEAADGPAGLQAYADDPADVVLLDIHMEEMDGIEVLIRLRETAPTVPVIAVTGGGRTPPAMLLDNARMLGATRTLTKPIEMDALVAAVDDVTGGRTGGDGS